MLSPPNGGRAVATEMPVGKDPLRGAKNVRWKKNMQIARIEGVPVRRFLAGLPVIVVMLASSIASAGGAGSSGDAQTGEWVQSSSHQYREIKYWNLPEGTIVRDAKWSCSPYGGCYATKYLVDQVRGTTEFVVEGTPFPRTFGVVEGAADSRWKIQSFVDQPDGFVLANVLPIPEGFIVVGSDGPKKLWHIQRVSSASSTMLAGTPIPKGFTAKRVRPIDSDYWLWEIEQPGSEAIVLKGTVIPDGYVVVEELFGPDTVPITMPAGMPYVGGAKIPLPVKYWKIKKASSGDTVVSATPLPYDAIVVDVLFGGRLEHPRLFSRVELAEAHASQANVVADSPVPWGWQVASEFTRNAPVPTNLWRLERVGSKAESRAARHSECDRLLSIYQDGFGETAIGRRAPDPNIRPWWTIQTECRTSPEHLRWLYR